MAMLARATWASLLFLLIARAASADDECVGGSCPVPSHFASAAPPEAPEFDVHELSDDGAWSKVDAGADAEEEEEGELDLGTETETMSMEDFKKMTAKSAAVAEQEPAADAGESASDAAAPAAAADAGESYGGSATTAAAPEAGAEEGAAKSKQAQSKQAQSKLAQSKVGRITEDQAGAQAAAVEEAPQAAAVEEVPFDLLTEISLMRVMAQMGATAQMMEILVNVTFALGDTDRDGQLSPAEGGAFAKAHLHETSPLAVVLGLSGGHLPLADEAATARAIESIRAKCDTDANGQLDRKEAAACAEWVYGLLVDANEKRLEHALKQQQAQQQAGGGAKAATAAKAAVAGAGAARAAAGGGAGAPAAKQQQQQQQQQQASSLNDWFQSMAAGGAGGAGGSPGAAARRKPSPIQAAIDRRLQMVQRVLLEHWRNPNMNTLMGGLGLAALVLRELLAIDLFELRRKLRGLVGSNVDEFNSRLMHVGLLSIIVAAVAKID